MANLTLRDLEKIEPNGGPATQNAADVDRLLAAACAMQCGPATPAVSRVVLEGLVRVAEFLLIIAAGLCVDFIAPSGGHASYLIIGIPLIAAGVVLALQCSDLYKISLFRNFPAKGLRLVAGVTFVYGIALPIIFT